MAPTRVARTKFDPAETFAQHITLKLEGALINGRAEKLKKRLKEWLPTAGDVYENEKGSKFWDLPKPVTVFGKTFTGMELRRSTSTSFNEDTAEEILTRKDVLAEAQSLYIDQDKVYALYQEGKITQKDLDKIFEEKESFAFWPVEGDPEGD